MPDGICCAVKGTAQGFAQLHKLDQDDMLIGKDSRCIFYYCKTCDGLQKFSCLCTVHDRCSIDFPTCEPYEFSIRLLSDCMNLHVVYIWSIGIVFPLLWDIFPCSMDIFLSIIDILRTLYALTIGTDAKQIDWISKLIPTFFAL